MLKNKRIIVTGGAGFLGKHLVDALIHQEGIPKENIFVPRSAQYDLRKTEDINKMFDDFKADIVVHLATVSGGMPFYKAHPAQVFHGIVTMGVNLMEVSRQRGVERFIVTGSTLSYPKDAPIPYKEDDLWKGYPEEVEAPYGVASKMLLTQAQAYKQEYNFNASYVILTNLYGPADHFEGQNAHVIPSMIKKFDAAIKSNAPSLDMWGTGKATREFLYVEDCAKAIISLIKNPEVVGPLNIGSGEEISIRELAQTVSSIMGYKGELAWDPTKPEGRLRRALDSSHARRLLHFTPSVPFKEGIKKTIEWYKSHSHSIAK